MTIFVIFRRVAMVLSISLISINAHGDPLEWLMKINKAAANANFVGTFVYIHDEKIEAMEVARKITNEVMQERIYSLNGEPREIIRDMNKVWCFIPDKNVVVHDYRQVSESGFPRILPRRS